jgi:hypothetical protein
MSKAIKPEDLGKAVQQELTLYSKAVQDGVNDAGRDAMKKLVKQTKATAPVGYRKKFKKGITFTEERSPLGSIKYTWGVKAPDHRLVHLLVHGHAKKNGGRTKSNPFLANALDTVLPEYERAVEEVIKNGK